MKSLENKLAELTLENSSWHQFLGNPMLNFMKNEGPEAVQPPYVLWAPNRLENNYVNTFVPHVNVPFNQKTLVPGLRHVPEEMSMFRLCEVEGISDKVVSSTRKSEFCDLSLYLSNLSLPQAESTEMSFVSDTGGNVQYKVKHQKRQVKSFSTWLEAWGAYESLMGNYHGMQVLNELARYRALIIEYEAKYTWPTIQTFDAAHMAKKSGKSIEFTIIDQNLWNQIFDSSTIKAGPKCTHCKSLKHLASECPLP